MDRQPNWGRRTTIGEMERDAVHVTEPIFDQTVLNFTEQVNQEPIPQLVDVHVDTHVDAHAHADANTATESEDGVDPEDSIDSNDGIDPHYDSSSSTKSTSTESDAPAIIPMSTDPTDQSAVDSHVPSSGRSGSSDSDANSSKSSSDSESDSSYDSESDSSSESESGDNIANVNFTIDAYKLPEATYNMDEAPMIKQVEISAVADPAVMDPAVMDPLTAMASIASELDRIKNAPREIIPATVVSPVSVVRPGERSMPVMPGNELTPDEAADLCRFLDIDEYQCSPLPPDRIAMILKKVTAGGAALDTAEPRYREDRAKGLPGPNDPSAISSIEWAAIIALVEGRKPDCSSAILERAIQKIQRGDIVRIDNDQIRGDVARDAARAVAPVPAVDTTPTFTYSGPQTIREHTRDGKPIFPAYPYGNAPAHDPANAPKKQNWIKWLFGFYDDGPIDEVGTNEQKDELRKREKAMKEKAAQEKEAQEKAMKEKAAREKEAQEKAMKEKAAREKEAEDPKERSCSIM